MRSSFLGQRVVGVGQYWTDFASDWFVIENPVLSIVNRSTNVFLQTFQGPHRADSRGKLLLHVPEEGKTAHGGACLKKSTGD